MDGQVHPNIRRDATATQKHTDDGPGKLFGYAALHSVEARTRTAFFTTNDTAESSRCVRLFVADAEHATTHALLRASDA